MTDQNDANRQELDTWSKEFIDELVKDKTCPSGLDEPLLLATLIYLRWADFWESEQEAKAIFDGTDYTRVLPDSYHWSSWRNLELDEQPKFLAKKLVPKLAKLSSVQDSPFAKRLRTLAEPVRKLSRVSWRWRLFYSVILDSGNFETPNVRAKLLHHLLDKEEEFSDLRELASEFLTPRQIAKLIVALADPSPGDRIYDPCFGTGAILTAAQDYVSRGEKAPDHRENRPQLSFSGFEIDPSFYVIGLARLTLNGAEDPQLEMGNSLDQEPFNESKNDAFDIVVADPPFGQRANMKELGEFPIQTKNVEGLFIQHALSRLRSGGRAVILVPDSLLVRQGSESNLRRMLIEQHTVEAVISLPEHVFPRTAMRTSILVLDRGGSSGTIRMVDAESFFEKGSRHMLASISDKNIEAIAKEVRSSSEGKHSWDVESRSLEKIDWDLNVGRRGQSGLLHFLDSLRGKVEVVPLRDCCSIIVGQPLRSQDLTQEAPAGYAAPFVRIGDLYSRGKLSRATTWVSPDVIDAIDRSSRLQPGDVLLSRSGTVGKASIVEHEAAGSVASGGLFIIRTTDPRLDPDFLLGYLTSSKCRNWLKDHATGSTIAHLAKGIVLDLPLPLPRLNVQKSVATQHREHNVDVLSSLGELLNRAKDNPIVKWLDEASLILPTDNHVIHDPLDLNLIDSLATNTVEIRNQIAHRDGQIDERLRSWYLKFSDSVAPLKGSQSIPPGPSLLSLLQQSSMGLSQSSELITGHLPNDNKARSLNSTLLKWTKEASEALLSDIRIVSDVEENTLRLGEMGEIHVVVYNHGPLPLRDVHIETEPDWGTADYPYLADNHRETLLLKGLAPKSAGTLNITVSWSGMNLAGRTVKGASEIGLEVISEVFALPAQELGLGASPYVCGDPVRPDRNDVFVGREELLEEIRRYVTKSGNVVLLEGNRRSGKSSILWHLEGPKAVPGWMGVYCSLQGAEGSEVGTGVPTAEIFRIIAISIAKSLTKLGGDTPLPDGTLFPAEKRMGITKPCRQGISEDSPFSDLRDYVEVALEKLSEHNLGLLLMLDEFDKLQEGIDNGVTSPQVPENIRFLAQNYQQFSLILTGSRRLKRLREEYWSALFGLGTKIGVTALHRRAAGRLVTGPVSGRLTYTNEAVGRAISMTAGQPFLLQCLCNRVFDMAAQLKTRSVTADLVMQASSALIEDNEHFASLWDYARSDLRRFILMLCHREASNSDPLHFGLIQERLFSHGIEVDGETLIADLEFLRELELIDLVGKSTAGGYVLTIPLMGMWMERQQDFIAVKIKAKFEAEDQNVR